MNDLARRISIVPDEDALSELIESKPELRRYFEALRTLGASAFSALFDRQNGGPIGPRIVLGPPARPEFNSVGDERVPVMNLATSGYLDLGNDPRVKAAAAEAIERFGTHTGGCRLLSGTNELHFQLEAELASFIRAASVVTYSSGYATNVAVIPALFGAGDLVILDRQAHRSLYDGALLSRAAIKRFRHNDLDHLESILRRTAGLGRRLIAVDAAYSMDADLVPLPGLVELVRKHGAYLLVDEAHAFGVLGETGRGVTEHFGMDPESIHIRIGTLSKAMAAAGGFAAVDQSVSALLRYASHGRVFSAAMTPPDAGAALAAVRILRDEPIRVARLRSNTQLFRAALRRRGVRALGNDTAIVPIWVGDRLTTLAAALALLARGYFVNPIVSPGVPVGAERLRCLTNAAHEARELESAADAIAAVLGEIQARH